MDEAKQFVAEHIMGFKRGRCQGAYSGGNISAESSDYWFWCDWCGREVHEGAGGPCPHYPFPRFSMRDLMTCLGDMGYHVMMRFDPGRDECKFTICLDGKRICDTDEPLGALCEYIMQAQPLIADKETAAPESAAMLPVTLPPQRQE